MKRIAANFFLGLAMLFGSLIVAAPVGYALSTGVASHVYVADARKDVCQGAALAGASCGDKGKGINNIIRAVINILSAAVGVAAVIMIIIGGLKYVTSGGDSNAVASAKHSIIFAVVGLVIVALAQTLVKFVLGKTK